MSLIQRRSFASQLPWRLSPVLRKGGAKFFQMGESNSLVIFERAAVMLLEADTIQKAKELKSLALTAADWAKRKGMGESAIQHCRSYALEAERKMGEMLASAELNKGGNPKLTCNRMSQVECPPTLPQLGISRRESAEAQRLAALPKETFDAVRDGYKTRTEVKREVRRAEAVKKVAEIPKGKFRVFYADPPWKYGDERNGLDGTTGATAHYPTMTMAELAALPIKDISADDAVLFLWTTSPLLFECAPVITAWGFKYKACFVWDKIGHNLGHYNSVRHEFLLVCTRGSCTPDNVKLFDSVQSIQKTDKHSEKPEDFREIIQTLYPNGRRIELFARTQHEGWERYGNEC